MAKLFNNYAVCFFSVMLAFKMFLRNNPNLHIYSRGHAKCSYFKSEAEEMEN